MFKLSAKTVVIILLELLIVSYQGCCGVKVNLTEICSGLHSFSCVIFGIQVSYEDPLVILDSDQEKLRELIIRDTMLIRFPRELLHHAPNLCTFVMHNTGLNRINAYDFVHASMLLNLILQQNRLSEIPEKVFSTMTSLKQLNLGQNNIHMIHRLGFFGLSQLSHLDLQQNAIHQLSPNLFSSLTNLEYLDLSGNGVSKIDSCTFENNSLLSTLLLNNNKFTVFEPNSLEHLPNLRLLDISNSVLEEIHLQSVDTLLAQNSSLKRCQIGSVVKFHASFNELKTLNVRKKGSVNELLLHGNLFESMDDFTEMVSLQHLDLSKNYISTLSNSHSPLMSLPTLTYLNLAFNKLTNLSFENFLNLPKLTHLDIAFNHFISLEAESLDPLYKLEKLYLAGNGLRFFDYRKFFKTHPFVKEIELYANSWDPSFMHEMIEFMKESSVQLIHHYPVNLREQLSTSVIPFDVHQHNSSPAIEYTTAYQAHSEKCQWVSSSPHILLIAIFVLVFLIYILQMWQICSDRYRTLSSWHRSALSLESQSLDEFLSEV